MHSTNVFISALIFRMSFDYLEAIPKDVVNLVCEEK